jgi:tRNA (guanine37-N1)-methyltransferase
MKIHIITIFPESFDSYFSSSIIWNAKNKGLFEVEFYKLNDFSSKKFGHVDDKAYGMHGQVLCAEPLGKAIDFIYGQVGKHIPVLYMSPSWEALTQEKVERCHKKLTEFIIICGHYEWIDQRVIDMYSVEKISIWEYVISSGELASMVFIDALVRHIPGVLWNVQSLEEDSFSKQLNRQKEYPVYTKPKDFHWLKVPEVLYSWNHAEIEKWKREHLS